MIFFFAPHLLRLLRPLQMTLYLRAKGWREVSRNDAGRPVAIFEFPRGTDKEPAEIIVPLNPQFRDYERLLDVALQRLQDIEGRSAREIATDVIAVTSDVLRIKIDPEMNVSDVPAGIAGEILAKSLAAIRAAALATVQPSLPYTPRRIPEVEQFMARVRLGHTEPGSFVLPLHVGEASEPLAPHLKMTSRDVTVTLCRAIDAALAEGVSLDKALGVGASINLLTALADMAKLADSSGLELTMSWAVAGPLVPASTPDKFRLSAEDAKTLRTNVHRLRSVAQSYRPPRITTQPKESHSAGRAMDFPRPSSRQIGVSPAGVQPNEFLGYVVSLQRRSGEPRGEASISVVSRDVGREISVILGAQDYPLAIEAHSSNILVRVIGYVERDGLREVIQRPVSFQLAK
jgi:hypothetical protein